MKCVPNVYLQRCECIDFFNACLEVTCVLCLCISFSFVKGDFLCVQLNHTWVLRNFGNDKVQKNRFGIQLGVGVPAP